MGYESGRQVWVRKVVDIIKKMWVRNWQIHYKMVGPKEWWHKKNVWMTRGLGE